MKKTILKFGIPSGFITSALMLIAIPLENRIGYNHSLYLGYTLIVLSFLLVFFGIRSYRESAGGHITFVRAFTVGISITLITCAFYVITWEILYFTVMHDFMDNYSAHVLEKARAAGAAPAALQARAEELRKLKEKYENVFYNSALTFMEPFPVGLLITLLSAAVLRRKPRVETAAAPLTASS